MNKANYNLMRFVEGSTAAFRRAQDLSARKIEPGDPLVNVKPIDTPTSTMYQWELICAYGLVLENHVDKFLDAGEARESAETFIEQNRSKIKLEELKAKAENEAKAGANGSA